MEVIPRHRQAVEPIVAYHSEDGQHFLGWRRNSRGLIEVVHDREGRRQVFELTLPPELHPETLSGILQEAVRSRNVVAALHRALSDRRVAVAREDTRG